MLRLGSGERELATDRDFSRWGRVNFMLERRQTLLERVAKLCRVLQVDEGFAQTCESSGHFYAHHVETRWTCFLKDLPTPADDAAAAHRWIMSNFPFADYFDDTLAPFWEQATDYPRAKAVVDGAWTHLSELFEEVRDCRAFELLRTSTDRGNYLLTKQARIIAMTCTHAALKRKDFLKHNFKYDTLVMEESAQVLEVETFIPMTLQAPLESGDSRLKRVVLIGDHHQLPPVVKNQTFQKYCHMDQSMFTRFVRLGVPTVQLEAQVCLDFADNTHTHTHTHPTGPHAPATRGPHPLAVQGPVGPCAHPLRPRLQHGQRRSLVPVPVHRRAGPRDAAAAELLPEPGGGGVPCAAVQVHEASGLRLAYGPPTPPLTHPRTTIHTQAASRSSPPTTVRSILSRMSSTTAALLVRLPTHQTSRALNRTYTTHKTN